MDRGRGNDENDSSSSSRLGAATSAARRTRRGHAFAKGKLRELECLPRVWFKSKSLAPNRPPVCVNSLRNLGISREGTAN